VAVPELAKVTPAGILIVSPDVPSVKVVPDCGSTDLLLFYSFKLLPMFQLLLLY